jgi:hypothetical protein
MGARGQRKPYYDRKVQAHGYTRLLSLGKVIPRDWQYVRIWLLKQTPTEVHVVIQRLLGVETDALVAAPSKRSKQNT